MTNSESHLDAFLNVAGDLAGDLAYHLLNGAEVGSFQPGIESSVGRLYRVLLVGHSEVTTRFFGLSTMQSIPL